MTFHVRQARQAYICIVQSTVNTLYFPPVSYLALAYQSGDCIQLEAYEHFQKGSLRHRCKLAGAQGPFALSVPLQKGKNQQMPIRDVQIAWDTPWNRTHWRSIRTAYGSAPFWPFYAEQLERLLMEKHIFLWDLNRSILEWLVKAFRLNGTLKTTTSYDKELPARHMDLRRAWAFSEGQYKDWWPENLTYPQVFEGRIGFCANLSAIDLLFCGGPEAFGVFDRVRASIKETFSLLNIQPDFHV